MHCSNNANVSRNDMLLGGTTEFFAPERDPIVTDSLLVSETLNFNVYAAEVIQDINPKAGPYEGGTEITVTGNNFVKSSDLACMFSTGVSVPAVFVSAQGLF